MADVTLRTYVFLDSLQPQVSAFIGTTARGFLPVAGDASLFILECEPAGYIAYAANEALKSADVKLIDMTLFGAFGRLYLAGTEAEIDSASEAAVNALKSLSGREK